MDEPPSIPDYTNIFQPPIFEQPFPLNYTNRSDDRFSSAKYEEFFMAKSIWSVGSPLILVVGTLGNLLSILVLTRKRLRYLTTMFYLTVLAVADLAVLYTGLLRLWLDNAFRVYIRLESDLACKIHTFLVYFTLDFSVWILVAVTVDRCVCVSLPFAAKKWCTLAHARVVVLAIAAFTFLINMHYFWTVSVIYEGSIAIAGDDRYSCYTSPNLSRAFFVEKVWPWIDFGVACLIPFVIMLMCNSLIIRQIVMSARKLLAHSDMDLAAATSRSNVNVRTRKVSVEDESKGQGQETLGESRHGEDGKAGARESCLSLPHSQSGLVSKKHHQCHTGNDNGQNSKDIDKTPVRPATTSSVFRKLQPREPTLHPHSLCHGFHNGSLPPIEESHTFQAKEQSFSEGDTVARNEQSPRVTPLSTLSPCSTTAVEISTPQLSNMVTSLGADTTVPGSPKRRAGVIGVSPVREAKETTFDTIQEESGSDVKTRRRQICEENSTTDEFTNEQWQQQHHPQKQTSTERPSVSALSLVPSSPLQPPQPSDGGRGHAGAPAQSLDVSRLPPQPPLPAENGGSSKPTPPLQPLEDSSRPTPQPRPPVPSRQTSRRPRYVSESRAHRHCGIPSLTVMLLTVNTLFWLLNAPIAVFVIGYAYWSKERTAREHAQLALGWSLVNMLQYTNNAIHFFLYCLTGPRFRQELATMCGKSPHRAARVHSSFLH